MNRLTKLAADGHVIEAAAARPRLMECPQQKPTLDRLEASRRMLKSQGITIVHELRDRIDSVRSAGRESVEYFKWRQDVEAALLGLFPPTEGRRRSAAFRDLHKDLAPEPLTILELGLEWKTFAKALDLSGALLASLADELDLYFDDDDEESEEMRRISPTATEILRDVFIVHGRRDALKEGVARFLSTLGLNPIILHERPNAGQTLIEKFESHAQVGFAIALFTADDVGRLNEVGTVDTPRARQNVILEFGFFLGKLGRHRACAVVESGVELPSDYSGVVHIPFDSAGHWKFELIRELRTAGYDVDANRAL